MRFILLLIFQSMVFSSLLGEEAPLNFGTVHLPNSGSKQAQQPFLQGLAAMHCFEYQQALIDFKKAQKIDPNFALAYWGEAMAYNKAFYGIQDLTAGRKVLTRLGKNSEERIAKGKTPLEKKLLESIEILYGEGSKQQRDERYSNFLQDLHDKNPDDVEILALYALSILGTVQPNELYHQKQLKAAGVIDAALGWCPDKKYLEHPGILHYYIHALDDPIHAELALKAAKKYGSVAPDSPHAVHMPAHIYMRLGLWDEAVQTNIKAIKVAVKRGYEGDNHSLSFLLYANLQKGSYKEAKKNVYEILKKYKENPSCDYLQYRDQMICRYVVEIGDCFYKFDPKDLEKISDCYSNNESGIYDFLYAAGSCAIKQNNLEQFKTALKQLQALKNGTSSIKDNSGESISDQEKDYRNAILDIEINELLALQDLKNNQTDVALEKLKKASDIEKMMALPEVIPEPLQSACELYADTLLGAKKWKQAAGAYNDAIYRTPFRAKLYLGLARASVGLDDSISAEHCYRVFLKIWKNADSNVPGIEEANSYLKNQG